MSRRLSAGEDEPVVIVEYDLRWPAMFAEEAARIAIALRGHLLGTEHIGSTAVEGLAAKPVIDIQVGVRSLQPTRELVGAMAEIGYLYFPRWRRTCPTADTSAGGRGGEPIRCTWSSAPTRPGGTAT